jgi:hypothetical protein
MTLHVHYALWNLERKLQTGVPIWPNQRSLKSPHKRHTKAERASIKKFSSDVEPTARLQKILVKDNSYHIGNFRLPLRDLTKSDQKWRIIYLLETDEVLPSPDSDGPSTEENWLEKNTMRNSRICFF